MVLNETSALMIAGGGLLSGFLTAYVRNIWNKYRQLEKESVDLKKESVDLKARIEQLECSHQYKCEEIKRQESHVCELLRTLELRSNCVDIIQGALRPDSNHIGVGSTGYIYSHDTDRIVPIEVQCINVKCNKSSTSTPVISYEVRGRLNRETRFPLQHRIFPTYEDCLKHTIQARFPKEKIGKLFDSPLKDDQYE